MLTEQFANNARTTLNGSISSSVTTIVVDSATAFPTVGEFRIIVDSEIMKVTSVTGANFTVTRGEEGTTAIGHSDGSPVNLIVTVNSIHKISPQVNDGRLTLTSGVPINSADVTGATTIYFTPYTGNSISLYDGSVWTLCRFAEISIALGTLTSGLPYDLFAYHTNGTVAFDAPLAWTNGTTRNVGLVRQDGVLCKSGNTTRRYIGTFYTTATTTTEDSKAKRFLWNMYHRARRHLERVETVVDWIQNTNGALAQANSNSANKVEVVIGVDEAFVELMVNTLATNPSSGSAGDSSITIGLDSTTVRWARARTAWMQSGGPFTAQGGEALGAGYPGIGYHYFAWLVATTNTVNVTFYGTTGTGIPGALEINAGMVGYVEG